MFSGSHVHPAEQLALLRAKIEYCSNMYSFKNKDQETERYRKHKSQTFIELTGLAKNSPMIMNESIRGDFVDMLHKNIVLPIPDYNEDMEEEIYKVKLETRNIHVTYCILGTAIWAHRICAKPLRYDS